LQCGDRTALDPDFNGALIMPQTTWQLLTTAPNAPSAHALASLLSAAGIVSQVLSDTVLLGECQACRVLVDSAQFHRAKWLLVQGDFTDEELNSLATGSLTADESDH
jgi:hypothetical protein